MAGNAVRRADEHATTPMRIVVLVAVMLAGAVARPALQSPSGYCGYIHVGGNSGGEAANGYASVIENGACWYGSAYAQVEVWAPGGGYDDGYGEGFGYAYAEAAAPLSPGLSGDAEVRGVGALEVYEPEWGSWFEGYEDWHYYPVLVSPGGGGGGSGGQCTAFGTVFVDYNQNGIYDAGDAPLSGTTVYLTDSSGSSTIDAYITGSSGGYEFEDLAEDSYRVTHPVPGGYYRTTDDSVPFTDCNFAYDFGIAPEGPPQPPTGQCSASGRVFVDHNENGTFDEGDDPFAGSAVRLMDAAGTTTIDISTTSASGGYQFQNMVEGSYRLWHPVPSGYFRTTDDSLVFSACAFEFDFGIAEEPQPPQPQVELRLFLDVEPYDFSAANPVSEDGIYVPGAKEDGSSVSVSQIQAGQQVRLYAAFVNQANQIVAPPANASVTFELSGNSHWAGYAMNQGSGTDEDFAFQGNFQNVAFSGNVAQVILLCKDYGGSVRVGASSNGTQAPQLRLPRDTNDNWLADIGWKATTGTGVETVPDNITDAWSDADGDIGPTGSPVPPDGVPLNHGWYGDGLIRFHEYRGFVVQGNHIRTDPRRLDIFMSHNVVRTDTQPQDRLGDALAFARSSLNQFRVTLHELFDQTQQEFTAEYVQGAGGQLNPNVDPGQTITGYSPSATYQRALRIVNGVVQGKWGNTTGSCGPPGQPAQSGLIPLNVSSMVVDVARLFTDGNNMPAFTTPMILNEIRKVVAHEIGHGIHISHRPQGSGQQCPDSANLGGTVSVMNDDQNLNGQDASFQGSRYNVSDIRQIRLHLRPNP